VAPTVAQVPAQVASASAPAEPPADVSALPVPSGLSFTVHLAHPRTTMQQLSGVLGSLLALFSGGGSKPDLEGLVTLAAGAPIGKVVELDQPVDLAVSDLEGEGEAKVAGSAVLTDPAGARETLEKYFTWTPTGAGVVRLVPRDDAPDDAKPRPCMLTPAFGSGGRIVCGSDDAAVRHLGPYLARTMTRVASTDDFRLEILVSELRAAKDKSDSGAKPDDPDRDPIDATLDRLGDELLDDVGSFVVEASSDGTTFDLKVTTGFTGSRSPLTTALLGLGAPGSPPPAAFDRLPRDAAFAWYGRGATAAALAPLKSVFFDVMKRSMSDDGYAPAVVEQVLAPLQRLALTGGPWVVGAGHPTDAARSAVDAAIDGKGPAAIVKAHAQLEGWIVAGVDEPSRAWIDGARALVKSDGLQPTGKPRKKATPQKETYKLAITPTPAALALPAGTLHVESRVTLNPAWAAAQRKAKASLGDPVVVRTKHFFVVPDGGRTWFAYAEDPALAATQVKASLAGAPDAGTLTARRDVDALRAMSASSAGYLSIAGVAMALVDDDTVPQLKKARETMRGLASLTSAGGTPIPITLAALPRGTGGGDLKMRVVFPIPLALEVAASPNAIFSF